MRKLIKAFRRTLTNITGTKNAQVTVQSDYVNKYTHQEYRSGNYANGSYALGSYLLDDTALHSSVAFQKEYKYDSSTSFVSLTCLDTAFAQATLHAEGIYGQGSFSFSTYNYELLSKFEHYLRSFQKSGSSEVTRSEDRYSYRTLTETGAGQTAYRNEHKWGMLTYVTTTNGNTTTETSAYDTYTLVNAPVYIGGGVIKLKDANGRGVRTPMLPDSAIATQGQYPLDTRFTPHNGDQPLWQQMGYAAGVGISDGGQPKNWLQAVPDRLGLVIPTLVRPDQVGINLQRFMQSLREMGQPPQAQNLVMGKVNSVMSQDTSAIFRDIMSREGREQFADTITAREHAKNTYFNQALRYAVRIFIDAVSVLTLARGFQAVLSIIRTVNFSAVALRAMSTLKNGMNLLRGGNLIGKLSAGVTNFVRGASGIASSSRNLLNLTKIGNGLISVGKGIGQLSKWTFKNSGLVLQHGAPMLLMGLVNVGIEKVHQWASGRHDEDRLWGAFFNGMVFGGVGKLMRGMGASHSWSWGVGGFAGGSVGSIVTQMRKGEIDWWKVFFEGLGGAVGGAVGGRYLDRYGMTLNGLVRGGTIGGYWGGFTGGGLLGGYEAYKQGGSLWDIWRGASEGAFWGGIHGAALGGLMGVGGYGFGRLTSGRGSTAVEGVGERNPLTMSEGRSLLGRIWSGVGYGVGWPLRRINDFTGGRFNKGLHAIFDGNPTTARALKAVGDWLRLEVCFAAGTPLRTKFGWKYVEDFKPGDKLLSRNEFDPNGPIEEKEVEEVFVRLGRIIHLHVSGEIIRTTSEHPFYVNGKGWLPVSLLEEGDWLLTESGSWVRVEEVYDTGEYEKVYNLRVAEWHTYFVGKDSWGFAVWAHNLECALADLNKELKAAGLSQRFGSAGKITELVLLEDTTAVLAHLKKAYPGASEAVLQDIITKAVARAISGPPSVTSSRVPDVPELNRSKYIVDGVEPIELKILEGNWRNTIREKFPGRKSVEGVYIVRDAETGQLYKPGKVKNVLSSRFLEYINRAKAEGIPIVLDFYHVKTARASLRRIENDLRTKLKNDGWKLEPWDRQNDVPKPPMVPVIRIDPNS